MVCFGAVVVEPSLEKTFYGKFTRNCWGCRDIERQKAEKGCWRRAALLLRAWRIKFSGD